LVLILDRFTHISQIFTVAQFEAVAYKAFMTRSRFTVIAAVALSGLIGLTRKATAESAGTTVLLAQAAPAAPRPMTYADIERLYLDGKISAKQYQKLLNDVKANPAPVVAPPSPKPPAVGSVPTPAAVPKPAPILPQTNKDDKISEVETKMDELLRAKAAREKATNPPPRPVSAGPKTKRERLNDLLRLYIEGKVTETEMNERRAKIVAEPD
jgi:hypothetical protein